VLAQALPQQANGTAGSAPSGPGLAERVTSQIQK
jgi:hypothetical protein